MGLQTAEDRLHIEKVEQPYDLKAGKWPSNCRGQVAHRESRTTLRFKSREMGLQITRIYMKCDNIFRRELCMIIEKTTIVERESAGTYGERSENREKSVRQRCAPKSTRSEIALQYHRV